MDASRLAETVVGVNANDSSWVFPLVLSCLAGASTCVGAAVVFCFEASTIRRSMAFSLSLAAAVMVTISFVSILPEVFHGIFVTESSDSYDFFLPTTTTTIVRTRLLLERLFSLGFGISAYLLLAKLMVFLPDPEHMYSIGEDDDAFNKRNDYDLFLVSNDGMEKGQARRTDNDDKVRRRGKRTSNHHHLGKTSSTETLSTNSSGTGQDFHDFVATTQEQRKRSWRVALMLFVSLLIHNFPEGLCVAASAKESPELGITVAIGIFIHNVPEGIAISGEFTFGSERMKKNSIDTAEHFNKGEDIFWLYLL